MVNPIYSIRKYYTQRQKSRSMSTCFPLHIEEKSLHFFRLASSSIHSRNNKYTQFDQMEFWWDSHMHRHTYDVRTRCFQWIEAFNRFDIMWMCLRLQSLDLRVSYCALSVCVLVGETVKFESFFDNWRWLRFYFQFPYDRFQFKLHFIVVKMHKINLRRYVRCSFDERNGIFKCFGSQNAELKYFFHSSFNWIRCIERQQERESHH